MLLKKIPWLTYTSQSSRSLSGNRTEKVALHNDAGGVLAVMVSVARITVSVHACPPEPDDLLPRVLASCTRPSHASNKLLLVKIAAWKP